jgi:hypothetical protein
MLNTPATLGPDSTWMGDRLGTPGAVGLPLPPPPKKRKKKSCDRERKAGEDPSGPVYT